MASVSEFNPDVDKIDENPFGFQEPARAAANLRLSISFTAAFFKDEILAESRLYDAWNKYQQDRDNVAIVKFALSLRHVMGVQQELAIVKACEKTHVVERLERFVVLLHIGLIEMLEGGTSANFRDWAIGSLKNPDFPLPENCTAPKVREYLQRIKQRYERDYGAARALREALRGGLNDQDKKQLLLAWTFSIPVAFGSEHERPRHLHCREREKAQEKRLEEIEKRKRRGEPEPPVPPYSPEMAPVEKYCLRYCTEPTQVEVEHLLPKLANRLYEMRSMIIHSASAVMFARPDAMSEEQKSEGTLFDNYFLRDGKMVAYETTAYVADVIAVLRRCLWNRFTIGIPL